MLLFVSVAIATFMCLLLLLRLSLIDKVGFHDTMRDKCITLLKPLQLRLVSQREQMCFTLRGEDLPVDKRKEENLRVKVCIIQTLLVPFMPVSNLFSQFDLLVDISVITNVFPYFLCMAATFVVVRRAGLQGVKKVCVEAAALGSLIFIGWYFSLMDGDVMKFATIVFFLGIAFYGLFVAKDGSPELPEQ